MYTFCPSNAKNSKKAAFFCFGKNWRKMSETEQKNAQDNIATNGKIPHCERCKCKVKYKKIRQNGQKCKANVKQCKLSGRFVLSQKSAKTLKIRKIYNIYLG